MPRSFELAALPSTLSLCLQSADRCRGLVQTAPHCVYVPRHFHWLEMDAMHAPGAVAELVAMGLLQYHAVHPQVVLVTDAGVELLNTGRAAVQVAA